mgnify:CR=1 FL=1
MSLRSAILGFLELEPTTGYTLLQRFEGSVGSFWTATQSQIYRELHTLEASGHVQVRTVPGDGKPARKVYSLTAAGRTALKEWLAGPLEPVQLRDPMQLRLVFAAEVDPELLDQRLRELDATLEQTEREYQARLKMKEIFELARSPRERALWELSIENGLMWCEAQRRWVAKARRKLKRSE